MTWFGIGVTYLRFYAGLKAQGYDRTKLPYYTRFQPYAAYYAVFMCFFICLVCIVKFSILATLTRATQQFSGWAVFLKGKWDTATFVTNYLPLILFPILYTGAKIWHRTPIVKASEMDFVSGIAEIEADTYDEPPPRNLWEKFWGWVVSSRYL